MEGKAAESGVPSGKRADEKSACGASSNSTRASSSRFSLRAYQRASGEGAKAASALPTRDQTSASGISSPSPKAPEGAPGGTKYARKRAWFRTHSFFERSMPAPSRSTYQTVRLLPVSQKACAVPLAKPPSSHPQGLVHATAAGAAFFTHSSAFTISPALSTPLAGPTLSAAL